MKIMVTGATGFVGRHLIDALSQRVEENSLYKTSLAASNQKMDLCNKTETFQRVEECRPDFVFHLAAQSNIPNSYKDPEFTFNVNLYGTLNLIQALQEFSPTATIIYVGSGESYGLSFNQHTTVDELSPLNPINPYATSKAAADLLMGQYSVNTKLKIIRARPLNHFGPGQSDEFVIPAFAKQLVDIERGLAPSKIFVGNLSAKRDFLDVRDVVSAYMLLFEKHEQIPSGSIFNICSGNSTEISSILMKLVEIIGIKVEIIQDENRMRPVEIPVTSADNGKIKSLGWRPKFSLEESLRTVVEHVRSFAHV